MAKTKQKKVKVTFAIPEYLVELADMQAEKLGMDRYDVIRMAIGQGLMVLRVNQELQDNPDRYAQDLLAITSGEPDAYNKLAQKASENAIEGLAEQKRVRDAVA